MRMIIQVLKPHLRFEEFINHFCAIYWIKKIISRLIITKGVVLEHKTQLLPPNCSNWSHVSMLGLIFKHALNLNFMVVYFMMYNYKGFANPCYV
jgi:hypothetical protein